ncbi:hypothetical protein BO82DRAFT_21388 [Aspergillus uvarum CBS 121591]|uniref:Uncharacterized protein n=1 Tax=Aspergillus uvarum CBS 121591 TaxID=1448315 RepID=A0A319BSR0_9EURO|nr:hypothetical protein BO82DRAFT_21388 [Aspergillus uvarum CBS 121591]PYH75511.1 hypothetical protein BO82DRAFT_21388 [Aspergillus uvarum CBS 121591]
MFRSNECPLAGFSRILMGDNNKVKASNRVPRGQSNNISTLFLSKCLGLQLKSRSCSYYYLLYWVYCLLYVKRHSI